MATTVEFHAIRVGDPPPVIDGPDQYRILDGEIHVSLLEQGTVEGNPAIAFSVVTDEEVTVFQFTYGNWQMLSAAMKGAVENWAEHPR